MSCIEIKKAAGIVDRVKSLASPWDEKYADTHKDITHKMKAHGRSDSPEGVRQGLCERHGA